MATGVGSRLPRAGGDPKNRSEAIFPGTSQTRTFTGTSAQSSAITAGVTIVRLFATQDCFVAFGANPTAAATSMFLAAGIVEYVGVTGGDKIAAIQSSAAGTLYITEGAT